MSYIPKDAVTQSFRSNKGVLTTNQIIELDNENKFTKYGQLELLQTQTISGALADFTQLQESVYNFHLFTFTDIHFSSQCSSTTCSISSKTSNASCCNLVSSIIIKNVNQGNKKDLFLLITTLKELGVKCSDNFYFKYSNSLMRHLSTLGWPVGRSLYKQRKIKKELVCV